MTTLFITRHSGAVVWAARRGLHIDRQLAHLDPVDILAVQVCGPGARFISLASGRPSEALAWQCWLHRPMAAARLG